jgi:hypothetical protein
MIGEVLCHASRVCGPEEGGGWKLMIGNRDGLLWRFGAEANLGSPILRPPLVPSSSSEIGGPWGASIVDLVFAPTRKGTGGSDTLSK